MVLAVGQGVPAVSLAVEAVRRRWVQERRLLDLPVNLKVTVMSGMQLWMAVSAWGQEAVLDLWAEPLEE